MRSGRRLWIKAVDGVQYAVVLTALVVAVCTPVGLLATGSLVGLKWLLFLVGLFLIGVGTVKLRPPPAGRENPRFGLTNSRADDGLGGLVGRLPPVAWLEPTPADHLSDGGRFLLAGALSWAVSFGLEAVLGVGVPTVG
ncbi:hypothetical protein OB920_12660 [Halobacteria archaeon HArc-gm2]|nr:hypothetical protein [Halobacteria archaeon HArc-gm2]